MESKDVEKILAGPIELTHRTILEDAYNEAEKRLNNNNRELSTEKLSSDEIALLNIIDKHAEKGKGVLAVLVTSLTHKIFDPDQDVRKHQENMSGGYSGRGVDMRDVTPFMKEKKFPAMAESGWLTRSLEQNYPYDLSYRGKITPSELKDAFLQILDNIETKHKDQKEYLIYLFQLLIISRDKKEIALAKPSNIPIQTIIGFLDAHFSYKYSSRGGARLPVLAVYSIYECLMAEVSRYSDKKLMPLKEHTAPDLRSGYTGDIEIQDSDGVPFEGIEIKHGIKIATQIIKDSFEKFKMYPIKRYYLLSTAGIDESEISQITKQIDEIAKLHGCQVVVNGIIPSLQYYLRLLKEPNKFIEKYVENLKKDKSLKFEHKEAWNKIVGGSGEG